MARKARNRQAPAAISRKLAVVNAEPEPITLELPEGQTESEGSIVDFPAREEGAPVVEETAKAVEAPETTETGEKAVENPTEDKSELILGKYKTQDELASAYKEMQSKLTQTAQEKAEQDRFYKDLLKGQLDNKPSETPIELSEGWSDKLYTDPKEAVSELTATITAQVRNELKAEKEQEAKLTEQEDQSRTLNWLNTEVADLGYAKDDDVTAIIDGFAIKAPANLTTYKARYEYAVNKYQKLQEKIKGDIMPEVQKSAKDIADMKRRASLSGATAPRVAPTLSQAAIVDLIQRNPAEYERRLPEIMRAYKEGRVK